MKRTRYSRRGGLTRDAELLIAYAKGLGDSGSRMEDRLWEDRLQKLVEKLLQAGNEDGLNAALDALYRDNGRAYDGLADLIEAGSESLSAEGESGGTDLLLIAAPILAWSRYAIPSGPLPKAVLDPLRVQLQAHVLGTDARLALTDFLWSPDQLPRGYAETFELTRQLAEAVRRGRDLAMDPESMPETNAFLSDMRYLIGVVAAPRGQALFRWQETDGSREAALEAWQQQGGPCAQPLFAGCAVELLLPDAYYAACRAADRRARPYSLAASVQYLTTTFGCGPDGLQAVIGGFYDRRLEEYRIGFNRAGSAEVVHGVVWPLLDAEDESSDIPGQIEAALRECGLSRVVNLDQRLPLEYCDDCGAPLYPDPEGEPVHAEMPETAEAAPRHLH